MPIFHLKLLTNLQNLNMLDKKNNLNFLQITTLFVYNQKLNQSIYLFSNLLLIIRMPF
jgi:hypothetical protein